ncbi:MAG TPA: hypothetical protein VMF69_19330 [Gemmataceae bacterium]|nr:hypothetical protein [Gemmataceae bacterium]
MAKKRGAKKIPKKPTKSEELLPAQTQTPNLYCEFLSPAHTLTGVWEPFLAKHSEWWERYRNGPIYLLPEPVVNQLAQATPSVRADHKSKALINESDIAAEHAFREMCHRLVIGIQFKSTLGI